MNITLKSAWVWALLISMTVSGSSSFAGPDDDDESQNDDPNTQSAMKVIRKQKSIQPKKPSTPKSTKGSKGVLLDPQDVERLDDSLEVVSEETKLEPAEFCDPEALVPGSELKYRTFNDGAQETVVLIHGLHSSSSTWESTVEQLKKKYRVIIYDMRGQGESASKGDDYSMDMHARDLDSLLNHLGAEKVHIIGHSLGARIALKYLEKHPDRVNSVVMEDMDTVPRNGIPTDEEHGKTIARLKTIPKTFKDKDEVVAKLTPFFGLESAKRFADEKTKDVDGHLELKFSPTASEHLKRESLRTDLTASLQGARVPVLLLKSTDRFSGVTPNGKAKIEAVVQTNPLVKMEEIPDSLHNIHKSKAAEFMRSVGGFLESSSQKSRK